MTRTEMRFTASHSAGEVSAILDRPDDARRLYVFAHGAGAGMRHRFMEAASEALGAKGIATFRYQFAYMEKRSRRPDPQPVLLATVRAAVAMARKATGDLPMLAGGKSMGGRMTSLASAEEPLEGVEGLVFFGFPLHPAGQPGTKRADHLEAVAVPMIFLQGTRDTLANLELVEPVVARLPHATLHVVEGADHSFEVPRKTGRSLADTLDDLAATIAGWADARDKERP
ncbi:MAG TPA: alpha/beta family hydrolase [Candidatus Eisenbacteria bacterium]|nr:alpha/beta family hydrolase [Candidatus Eisenbacteria bacterium]